MAVGDGGSTVERLISTSGALGNTTIDLSRKKLEEVPPELFDLQHLEFLYLEGNYISSLPDGFFEKLSNLRWLDLRNNCLTELPSTIGQHKNLRTVLLEGNKLRTLPFELGLCKSLSGLNLTGNPLESPPIAVIERGTQEVLRYLREQLTAQENEGDKTESSSDESEEGRENNLDEKEPAPQESAEEKTDVDKNRLKLPPIFQKVAQTSKNANRDYENEHVLKGYKAKQFEPVDKPKAMYSTLFKDLATSGDERLPGSLWATTEADEIRKRNRKKSKEREVPVEKIIQEEKVEKPVHVVVEEKPKPRKKSKAVSPVKEKTDRIPSFDKLPEINSSEGQIIKICDEKNQIADPRDVQGDFKLEVGDMVAIKVAEKHFIKGQPCVGRVHCLPDQLGFLTVHYYTGVYGGSFRPMMSRSSPYLRKVMLRNVLCKFKLEEDGRMTPRTSVRVRQLVDQPSQ